MIIEVESGVELAKCPFCGSKPSLRMENSPKFKHTDPDRPLHYWVKCPNDECAVSPRSNKDQNKAVENWNKRAA